MGSTFGAIQVAASGMSAARAGIESAGNNIANSGTDGYTRQRVNVTANPDLARMSQFTLPTKTDAGQGARILSVERLGNDLLESRLRSATGEFAYVDTLKEAYNTLELSLNEPSSTGMSTHLSKFWSSWQDLANNPDSAPAASALIEQGSTLGLHISSGYTEVSSQWNTMRSQTSDWTRQLNTYADQLGEVNKQIVDMQLAGGSANELFDSRDRIAISIADLSGGDTRIMANGTAEVSIGGNLLVTGTTVNKLQLAGANNVGAVGGDPARLEWTARPGTPVSINGGKIGGALNILGPANLTGTGGALAEAAKAYNDLATEVASQVNAIHQNGQTANGTTGLDFFAFNSATAPPAMSLIVVPTNAGEIASGRIGSGPLDGSNALLIGQIATKPDSPDKKVWASFVSTIAVTAQTTITRSAAVEVAFQNATAAELSNSSVDLTEENIHLLTSQDHFEAAARALTTLDEMLDTIINRTGLVGR